MVMTKDVLVHVYIYMFMIAMTKDVLVHMHAICIALSRTIGNMSTCTLTKSIIYIFCMFAFSREQFHINFSICTLRV